MKPIIVTKDVLFKPDVRTIRKLLPYIWPTNLPQIRLRVIFAFISLIMAKGATLAVPLLFKSAIDALTPLHQAIITLPVVLVISYGIARLLSSLFSEVRDGIFATVTQRAVRQVGLSVFHHLHNLGLRYHLERQTGGLSRAIERGTK